jgi:hypothetical protein
MTIPASSALGAVVAAVHHRTRPVIARDPLRLAAARLAADYVWRAEAWAGDVDEELVVALEQLHQRILRHIGNILTYVDGADEDLNASEA